MNSPEQKVWGAKATLTLQRTRGSSGHQTLCSKRFPDSPAVDGAKPWSRDYAHCTLDRIAVRLDRPNNILNNAYCSLCSSLRRRNRRPGFAYTSHRTNNLKPRSEGLEKARL